MLRTEYAVINLNVDDIDLSIKDNTDDYVFMACDWSEVIDFLKQYDYQEVSNYSILELDISDDNVSDPVGVIVYAADVFIRNYDKNIVKVQVGEV